MIRSLILLFLSCWATLSLAQDKRKIESADSILDRLERKLLEQEASTLRLQPPPVRTKPDQKIDMPASSLDTITGKLPQQQDFEAIEQELLALEQNVDDLSGQVEKLKSEFQTQASKGALFEIIAQLEAPAETSLREFTLTINGHPIYSRNDQSGWNPGSQILIYSGPLEPGEHEVSLKARTVRRYGEGLPLDQNLYHQYQQNFKISLPKGTYRKGYRLKLAKPEQQNTHAQAVIEAYDIP